MCIIDKHLQTIFGIDYNLYRITKDCAEQVNVVCRHARNPKNLNNQIEINNSIINQNDILDEKQFDEYESFQEQLFIQANGKEKNFFFLKFFFCLGLPYKFESTFNTNLLGIN
jgi:hypothetical protein